MQPTRQAWGVGGLVVVLAGYAVLVAAPLALAGAVLIAAWLLARQAVFTHSLERTRRSLSVVQQPVQTSVRTGESTPVSLTAALEVPAELALTVRGGVPSAARVDEPLAVSLEPGAAAASTTATVEWPVAGHYRFEAPTLTATDGWFRETLSTGAGAAVTVDPPTPRTIHLGAGGDAVGLAYGEHLSERRGSGLEPVEIRQYAPGDTADHIDWKATARLGSPHVREYNVETDRRTLFVVDHRAPLGTGSRGETKLAYLREVALALAARSWRLGDPIGLVTVGDTGLTHRLDIAAASMTHRQLRRHLLTLEPTSRATRSQRSPGSTAGVRRQARTALGGDSSPFATQLRPFFAGRPQTGQAVSSPLARALRTMLTDASPAWVVLCTDDNSPTDLRDAVAFARDRGAFVTVLLAPTVLYEPGGLGDLEAAYERYLEFETLRRDLARMDRVTALEVGPEDRLTTVLEAGRRRREPAGGTP
ncbi:DUF58 domain-containing protein [Natronosalvus rutilus]|uniref:DUF58 domain-containing protein n=1 Tax=Natronosalvus rutilus TaxID=2953753 RepID=A0A9E7ND63_9EURY|nr:DUF58 domain-containing protein [Natronosalvus rutilus]UTF54833.1 DUF58 domain-containing protein [Natronosalvus rutilus]